MNKNLEGIVGNKGRCCQVLTAWLLKKVKCGTKWNSLISLFMVTRKQTKLQKRQVMGCSSLHEVPRFLLLLLLVTVVILVSYW